MNFNETLDYLYSRLPVFQKQGGSALKPGLERTNQLLASLHNPHHNFKSIHVGGTNGKGSVSHMLAAGLMEQGYKVGLYTSPHLYDFTERIKVNGEPCDYEFVVDFVERITPVLNEINPSFFEVTVAMAFEYFAQQNVDHAVVEVGMGGRLDSTNVINPILSVITNVSLDHTQYLGETIEEIAYEKAGIIKPGVPVIIGSSSTEYDHVFKSKAKENHAEIVIGDKAEEDYEKVNRATTKLVFDKLVEQGIYIKEGQQEQALNNYREKTGLRGRYERLHHRPEIICDVAHNEAGIASVISKIKTEEFENLHVVLGMVEDKNHDAVLNKLPSDANYYFTAPTIDRALDVEVLADKAERHGLIGRTYKDVNEATINAIEIANPTDLILITGSFFIIADLNRSAWEEKS